MTQIEKYPQLRWLIPTLVFFLIFIMAARTPIDSDMWWQVKSGEVTLNQLRPLTWDVFTNSVTGKSWVNPAWFGQVLFYLFYRGFSFSGITALIGLAAATSMMSVFYQMDSPYFFRAFVLIAFSLVAAPVWTPRPQILSLVFFAVLTYIIYLFRNKEKNYLFWLPVIFLIWSNTHGGYTLGFILLGSVFIGEILNRIFDVEDDQKQNNAKVHEPGLIKKLLPLILWTIVSGFAVLINANSFRILTIPFQTIGIGVLQDFIPEWASPNFHNLVEQPFLLMLVATICVIGLSGKRMDGVEIFTLVVFTAMALLAKRNFGPFVVIAAPIFGKYGWLTISRLSTKYRDISINSMSVKRVNSQGSRDFPRNLQITLNVILVFLCLFGAFVKVKFVTSPEIMGAGMAQIFPTKAVEWLKTEKPSGNLFNDYNWGGYLIWQLPDYPVFIDGRTDLFGEEFLQDYLNTYSAEPGWQALLDSYDVQIVLVPTDSPIAQELKSDLEWETEYQDTMSIILIKKSP